MSLNKPGALPSQAIRDLIRAGFIIGADQENVRPSSLDLSLSDEAYEVEGIFQPQPDETVREVLQQISKKKH
ncbi:MAG: 2'-deoxycytidine 5'-triphosphate deaminase, partial [Patescibacteria group bacterium]